MYLIVIGASAEGRRFIQLAVEKQHKVALIEKDEEAARRALNGSNIRVFQADIAADSILEEAKIDTADAVIATTSDDSVNLMAMVLAKEYDVQARISLLNNPAHREMFEKLGVSVIADPASIIAHHLYHLLPNR
ncbi:MAG: TrkA family potassium uptake protein [Leptolyngbya sp. SIO4C1]|nr:TrkA family potassium uptake protein [Leptolyngbya sp. SIO4C1]